MPRASRRRCARCCTAAAAPTRRRRRPAVAPSATLAPSAPADASPTTSTQTARGAPPPATAPLRGQRRQRRAAAFTAGGATIQADVGEQRAHHHGARAALQQPARGHRQARRAARAGVRRGADRRGHGRQGGRVRHPVAGPARALEHATACRASAAPTSARAAAATTSSTRRSTSAALGQGLNLGIINGTITIPGLGIDHQPRAPRRARSSTDSSANILSTPTLLTLDNEEARIIVGQNVPFITGQYATTGTTTTPHAVPDDRAPRRRPHAARQAADHRRRHRAPRASTRKSRACRTTAIARARSCNKRALESTVVVDDEQIVVLGGLIQDSFTDGTDKVPVVGDLPFLGALFRYDTRSRQKTNLMVFLQADGRCAPTRDGRAITTERYDYLRGEQERAAAGAPRWFWNDPTVPEAAARRRAMPGTPRRRHRRRCRRAPPLAATWRRACAGARVDDRAHARRRSSPIPAARPRAIPYAFARTHGVLAWRRRRRRGRRADAPDATRRRHRRAAPRAAACRSSRARSTPSVRRRARARLQPGAVAAAADERAISRATSDLARLMQDLPPARGPARQRRAGAGHPHDQRAAAAGAARARVRPALRAVRGALGRALPHRRRAARRDRAAARAARGAGVAPQDHGEPRHRREAPAAGRPHRAEARRQAASTCACRRCPPAPASAWCCACSTRIRRGSTSPRSA